MSTPRTYDECLDRARQAAVNWMLSESDGNKERAAQRICHDIVPTDETALNIVTAEPELRKRELPREGMAHARTAVDVARLVLATALHDRVIEMMEERKVISGRPQLRVIGGFRA